MSPLLTDANGVPFERPRREDYACTVDFLRAFHAYKDRVANYANTEFVAAFSRALRSKK